MKWHCRFLLKRFLFEENASLIDDEIFFNRIKEDCGVMYVRKLNHLLRHFRPNNDIVDDFTIWRLAKLDAFDDDIRKQFIFHLSMSLQR